MFMQLSCTFCDNSRSGISRFDSRHAHHYFTWEIARTPDALKRLGRRANIRWKHNALRHSHASYRLAEVKNAAQVSLKMGNSPKMVFRHYRELVTDVRRRLGLPSCLRQKRTSSQCRRALPPRSESFSTDQE